MEQVKTTNIISTPEITGNIGSCTSQSIKIETGYNLLKTDYKTIVTNSCTGQVERYDTWSLGVFPWVFIVIGMCVFWIIIIDRDN